MNQTVNQNRKRNLRTRNRMANLLLERGCREGFLQTSPVGT